MNFVTALLDRLVPGRGGATESEGKEQEGTTEPLESESIPAEGSAAEPRSENTARIRTPPPADADIDDEDVVLRQLIAHGGRVTRSTLVEEIDWEESDLDDVLRGMEREAQISTINRRDPLVCRRGFEPAGAPLRFKND